MTDNKIIELTPFRADLTRALSRRGERLLASTDLAVEVAKLEPLEAYYVVREIGLDLALPIIIELSSEQLMAGIDLDCWHGTGFAADSLDEWMQAYALAGPEALAKGFLALDHVVQLLFLCRTVTVYDPDTDQVPPEKEASETPRVVSPDGFYILDLKSELDLKIHPYTLLDALYKYDSNAAFHLLRAVRVDLPTQIEEEALRFRNGRMEDIGFVGPEEAAVLFSRPSPEISVIHQKPLSRDFARLPAVYAESLGETTLLPRVMGLIKDPECLARLEQEIVWAINSAIIAYGEKTRDIDQITEIAERVRDTISLGLETLIANQEVNGLLVTPAVLSQAADLLEVSSVNELFRHGFAATLPLQQQLQQAMASPDFRDWYNLADTDQSDEPSDRLERAFVTALRGRHPLRGGIDLAKDDGVTAFSCLDEIHTASERLKQLVAGLEKMGNNK